MVRCLQMDYFEAGVARSQMFTSRREMCTSSIGNMSYHKFLHGAAFYTLNGKNVNVMLESMDNVMSLKLYGHTCNNTLARIRNVIGNFHVNNAFLFEIRIILKAVKSLFKGHMINRILHSLSLHCQLSYTHCHFI